VIYSKALGFNLTATHPLSYIRLFLELVLYLAQISGLNATAYPDQGNPKFACWSGNWTDAFSFFLLNYVDHAETIKIFPVRANSSLPGI
jgi:hypothetical protein